MDELEGYEMMQSPQQQSGQRWFLLAPLGLTLVGLGLSITGQAMALRSQRRGFWRWFSLGTLGLIVLNSGISVFGDAVKRKAVQDSIAAVTRTANV